MSEIVLVALITAVSTLLSGPAMTLVKSKTDQKQAIRASNEEQLEAVRQGVQELFELQTAFVNSIATVHRETEMGIQGLETPEELFDEAWMHFSQSTVHSLTSLSFKIKNERIRGLFKTLELEWQTSLQELRQKEFGGKMSSEEYLKNSQLFITNKLNEIITTFAGDTQDALSAAGDHHIKSSLRHPYWRRSSDHTASA